MLQPRRGRIGRILGFGAVLLALAVVGFISIPVWLPKLPGGDAALIKYERSQRLMRWSFGLPMPGEPDLASYADRLKSAGVAEGAPVLIRIFKSEFELELWMQRDGVFQLFATYPICRWSGVLGPKLQQGDRQAPEGFYTVDSSALNPNSRWYRSFNLGFPNAFDRAHGRTGSLIMVHGGCGSIGCFAMTNAQMQEIWKLVTGALSGGQKRFQVQVFPFRMTPEQMAKHASSPAIDFWKSLKTGNDLFEARNVPPKVTVCGRKYQFEPGEKGSAGADSIDDKCTNEDAKS
ncbi:murein L,D-transpeptidase family protein [Hyphomicrobium sp.]|uniref:murein L,D-transpeptidase family protein n=1 Tax=Hyphomicrobium sp. TaxID=82 RepID=UPI0025C32A16|nr:murein L,D-transpeptidase family protein [Hyphomicrobium sp.]